MEVDDKETQIDTPINTDDVQTRKKKRKKKKKEGSEEVTDEKEEESVVVLRTKKKSRKSPRNKESEQQIGGEKKRRHSHRRKQKTIRWKHLPLEIQSKIFSYFTIKDVGTVTIVCRKWQELYYQQIEKINFRENFSRIKCSTLSGIKIYEILSKFNNLSELSLGSCSQITNNIIKMIFKKFQKTLKIINLNECSLISDSCLDSICSLELLTEISLSSCPNISTEACKEILIHFQNQLVKIDFSFNKQVNDSVLNHLGDMDTLKTLDITCTNTRGKFFSYATISIEELYLNSCNHLKLSSFVGYLEYFKNIRVLDLSYYFPSESTNQHRHHHHHHQFRNNNSHMMMDDSSSSDENSKLECINDCIPFIIDNLQKLEVLILRGNILTCNSIIEIGKASTIKVLDIVACRGFSLDSICEISNDHSQLQYLDLTGCVHLNNIKAFQIIKLCLSNLKLVYLPSGELLDSWNLPENSFDFDEDSYDSDMSSSDDHYFPSSTHPHSNHHQFVSRASPHQSSFKTDDDDNLYSRLHFSNVSDHSSMPDDLDDNYF